MARARIVDKAIKIAGGAPTVARELGITRQAIYQWGRVPVEHVIPLERATAGAVTRHQLRPDIYPLEPEAAA